MNRYADLPIGYTIDDGNQRATKTADNEWKIVGDFHGDAPDEVRHYTDADMLDEWGDDMEGAYER